MKKNSANFVLKNKQLKVELSDSRPAVKKYKYIPLNQEFDGARIDGKLSINGKPVPWEEWKVSANIKSNKVTYKLSLPEMKISFDILFSLGTGSLVMELKNIKDTGKQFKTLDWVDMPLLVCTNPGYSYWRVITTPPDKDTGGGKMWMCDIKGDVKDTAVENEPVPVIYGNIFNPDKLCVFVHSNFPLFPIKHQVVGVNKYAMSLNTYYYRVRNKIMPSLKAEVVFLEDINKDGKADTGDYCIWLNRKIKDGDTIYRKSIIYKIFMDSSFAGLMKLTNLKQAEEIIKMIYNVSDGLSQIPYLVGCQAGGHDASYPKLDGFNPNIGTQPEFADLVKKGRQKYNTIVSTHANIDDCYENNPGYDEKFCDKIRGITHTIDAETGEIFKRLAAFFKDFPVKKTLHFDNLRMTNTLVLTDCKTKILEGTGRNDVSLIDELVCGLMPVMDWLRKKGITVTTEGQNGIPVDLSKLLHGLWHYDTPLQMFQVYHRKVMGGGFGSHFGQISRYDFGLVQNIHQDISYEFADVHEDWIPEGAKLIISAKDNWQDIVDKIYRGVLLTHFYLEREMTNLQIDGENVHMEFGKKEVIADVTREHVKVTWGDVVVAEDDDRFIPRDNAIYVYSLAGIDREWVLPKKFRGKKLKLFTLTKDGRSTAPDYELKKTSIKIKLQPGVPVKIML